MRISHSAKETYQECAFKYFNSYMRKLRPVGKKSALLFGDSVDKGLNHLLETRNLDEALVKFHESWKENAHAGDITYSKSDLDEHLVKDMTFTDDKLKVWTSLDIKGEILIREYNVQIMPSLSEVIKVQIDETVKNKDGDELVIKTDFIGVWQPTSQRILFDNKTSSVKYGADSVRESAQLGTYYETLKEEYKIDACGFIVIPKRVNKKKLPIVDITVIIDNVPEETIERTFEEYDQVIANIKAGYFPRNEQNCFGKYGKCDYFDYCKYGSTKGLVEKI